MAPYGTDRPAIFLVAASLSGAVACGGASGGSSGETLGSDGGPASNSAPSTSGTPSTSDDGPQSQGEGAASDGPAGSSSGDGSPTSSATESGPSECDASGFHVEDGVLLDVNCNAFVVRGINYPYAWFAWRDDTAEQLQDIASVGANAVRLVLANGAQWERTDGEAVAEVIAAAQAAKLVAILEVHDATGWSEQASAAHPDTAVEYWTSADVAAAISGHEDTVIINVANEPLGNTTTDQWVPFHRAAVEDLRAAGLEHTLIVDAPNWGQDWTNTMREGTGAQQILDADPQANTLFSVHMYEVYGDDAAVRSYFEDFLGTGLALVVGEFASSHNGQTVAAQSVLSHAQTMNVGYLGWSWSGNSGDLSALDIVLDFNVASLSPWGALLVEGTDGLMETSTPCTCFDGA